MTIIEQFMNDLAAELKEYDSPVQKALREVLRDWAEWEKKGN